MGFASFENLYSYKERKNKGNLEDFFTELINLFLFSFEDFKRVFIKDFLHINDDIDISKIVIVTQKSVKSNHKGKTFDRPDLIIYLNEQDEQNEKPFIVCEHKIDDGNYQKINEYCDTFKDSKYFRLIVPIYYHYSKNGLNSKIEVIHWESLFDLLDEKLSIKFFNLDKSIEGNKLIYLFLEFMKEKELIMFNKIYFLKKYYNFKNFIVKLRESLKYYREFYEKTKKLYNFKGSKLQGFFLNDFYFESNNKEYSFYYNGAGINFEENNKLCKPNIKFDKQEEINFKEYSLILYEFYILIKKNLSKIFNEYSNPIKEIEFADYTNDNQIIRQDIIEVIYQLEDGKYRFDIWFKNSKILFGYEDKKKHFI